MLKIKPVTSAEIKAAIEPLLEAVSAFNGFERRMSNSVSDDMAEAMEWARELIVVARDLNQFALRLFSAHDLHKMKQVRAQMETTLQKRRSAGVGVDPIKADSL